MADTTSIPLLAPGQAEQVGGPGGGQQARSLWSDAWRELRGNPIFWISAGLIVIILLMAIVPQLFTQTDPNFADLRRARESPSFDKAWFGMDSQGYDVYSRTIHGARSSLIVGLLTTVLTVIIGGGLGTIGAYLGGWVDAVLSRIGEIFFAIPLILGGLLFLYQFPNHAGDPYLQLVGKVVLVMTLISWPQTARVMRSSVLQVKPNDYVQAARALGASPARLIFQHILPNAAAPVIVVATINLGVFIATEGTLSFLGIGLQPPAISWGQAISDASGIGLIRTAPHMLIFPSLFLSITVLAFIMLGDAVRDALDPKLR
ncbi:ABC transporter permease [Microlunatus sp. GCM10028923]|uniref:ABC transporter permease n=1 Tax=Microlunatus sp. GCM10028923 TaxID=3273400 RepID=UPI00361D671E